MWFSGSVLAYYAQGPRFSPQQHTHTHTHNHFAMKCLLIIKKGKKYKIYCGGGDEQTLLYKQFLKTMNSNDRLLITMKEK